jgi:hypothetical protein
MYFGIGLYHLAFDVDCGVCIIGWLGWFEGDIVEGQGEDTNKPGQRSWMGTICFLVLLPIPPQ